MKQSFSVKGLAVCGVCIALGVIFAFWILIFVFIARSSARNAI